MTSTGLDTSSPRTGVAVRAGGGADGRGGPAVALRRRRPKRFLGQRAFARRAGGVLDRLAHQERPVHPRWGHGDAMDVAGHRTKPMMVSLPKPKWGRVEALLTR